MDESNIIRGWKFRDLSDVAFSLQDPFTDEKINEIHSKNCIIFCKIDFVPRLFSLIGSSTHSHVLITHNGDLSVTYDLYDLKPDCIKYWYGQNMRVDSHDCCGIPIGLENSGSSDNCDTVLQYIDKGQRDNKCYLNLNIHNNPTVRQHVVNLLGSKDYVTYQTSRISFDAYSAECSSYRYVLSPNGYSDCPDCHRTWEAIYMGVMPVVVDSVAMRYFYDLPIVLVEKWEDISIEHLNSFDLSDRTLDKADMMYWKDRILSTYDRL